MENALAEDAMAKRQTAMELVVFIIGKVFGSCTGQQFMNCEMTCLPDKRSDDHFGLLSDSSTTACLGGWRLDRKFDDDRLKFAMVEYGQ